MKKLTRKQRAAIYLKAAKCVLEPDFENGCCFAIKEQTGNNDSYYSEKREIVYPEFHLFYQDDDMEISWNCNIYWKWDNAARCIGLLLCHEMAKNPIV